jgi:DNA-binding PadR family transcriptional regulator
MARSLGKFEQLILLAILDLPPHACYGVPIRELIQRRTGRTVSAGAVYVTLDRLSRRGLVSSKLGEPTAERGGRRKRMYRLEPPGAKLLAESLEVMKAMSRGALHALTPITGADPGHGRRR